MVLKEALKNVRSKLSKSPVALTTTLFKAANRFVAIIALENNTVVDAAKAHKADVAYFLRGYPVPALVSVLD